MARFDEILGSLGRKGADFRELIHSFAAIELLHMVRSSHFICGAPGMAA
jgi:hypothetical protein